MPHRTGVLAFCLSGSLLACPCPAPAQEAPAPTSDLTTVLRIGDRVWITPRGREEVSGRVVDVSRLGVSVQSRNGREALHVDELLRVRRRQADPPWRGVIIGGAVGFGVPFAYCSAASESGETCGENVRDLMNTAAMGAAIGLLVDLLVKERKTVYERNVPRVNRKGDRTAHDYRPHR